MCVYEMTHRCPATVLLSPLSLSQPKNILMRQRERNSGKMLFAQVLTDWCVDQPNQTNNNNRQYMNPRSNRLSVCVHDKNNLTHFACDENDDDDNKIKEKQFNIVYVFKSII